MNEMPATKISTPEKVYIVNVVEFLQEMQDTGEIDWQQLVYLLSAVPYDDLPRRD